MDKMILEKIYDKEYYLFYLRMHPEWYITLNRNPEKINDFFNVAKEKTKQTTTDKIDKIKNQVTLASLMLDYFKNQV